MVDWVPLLIYFAIGFGLGFIVSRLAKILIWIIAIISIAAIVLPQLGLPIQVDPETVIGKMINSVSAVASVLSKYWTGPLGLLAGILVGLYTLAKR